MKFQWTLCLMAAMLPLTAQQVDNQERTLRCEENNWGDSRRERFCEVREYPLAAVGRISVDGRQNGGIAVKGWSRKEILVRAKVEAWAPAIADARNAAGQVHVQTGAGNIYATGPEQMREGGWAASYEIFVPHQTSVSLKAHNGGIRITDVTGEMDFNTVNGGLALQRLGGTVKGTTTNGGVKAEFTGTRWEGTEFDVRTTNGGVSLTLPRNYSARLETRTVHGHMAIDFPITVTGRIGREITTNLGQGGPLVRAVTTNGSVAIRTAN